MLIGYVRVSTAEQNSARQEVLMRELGVEKVYLDKASGKNANRPQLQEMLSFARQGDTIVAVSYTHLLIIRCFFRLHKVCKGPAKLCGLTGPFVLFTMELHSVSVSEGVELSLFCSIRMAVYTSTIR